MLTQVVPLRLLVIGFILLLGSWLVLFLTVVKVVAPGFLLSLMAYAASVAGLVIGLFGAIQYLRHARDE